MRDCAEHPYMHYSPKRRYRKQGRKTAFISGGRFGKRRVCDLGHVIKNGWIDRHGPLAINLFQKLQTAPNAKKSLDRRIALKAKKSELYKVPSACKKDIIPRARPQRMCCPRMHFEAHDKIWKQLLGNRLFKAKPGSFSGELRPLFGGRIPAGNSRPDFGRQ